MTQKYDAQTTAKLLLADIQKSGYDHRRPAETRQHKIFRILLSGMNPREAGDFYRSLRQKIDNEGTHSSEDRATMHESKKASLLGRNLFLVSKKERQEFYAHAKATRNSLLIEPDMKPRKIPPYLIGKWKTAALDAEHSRLANEYRGQKYAAHRLVKDALSHGIIPFDDKAFGYLRACDEQDRVEKAALEEQRAKATAGKTDEALLGRISWLSNQDPRQTAHRSNPFVADFLADLGEKMDVEAVKRVRDAVFKADEQLRVERGYASLTLKALHTTDEKAPAPAAAAKRRERDHGR